MSRITRKLRKWSVDILDLPQDLVFNMPRLTMIGNKQLLIENHTGVLHFSSELLRISTVEGTLSVHGNELMIKAIMPDEVLIEGLITTVQYLETGDKR